MLHIHVPLFHLLSCNSLLHPQVKLERSRIAPIIPMEYPRRAGKSCPVHRRCSRHRDHPRVGGEKVSPGSSHGKPRGSPPHGRGKGPMLCHRCQVLGITPALAGKSTESLQFWIASEDHPRVGGEKFYVDEVLPGDTGSPPRGRGKVLTARLHNLVNGITPAWAGKSQASQPWSPPLWMMVIRPRP